MNVVKLFLNMCQHIISDFGNYAIKLFIAVHINKQKSKIIYL